MKSFLSLFESTSTLYTHVVHTHIPISTYNEEKKLDTMPRFTKHYYYIPAQYIKNFYDLYLETVKNSTIEEFVYVCEFSPMYSHLLFDIDFNFATYDADVSEDQVKIVVKLLEAGIRKYAPVLSDVSCIVLKRSYAIKKIGSISTVYRRGLHIHFPFIISHYKLACMIKKDIMHYLETEWNSKFFDINHVNNLDDVIDDHIFCQRTLQLYKSTRPEHYKDNCYIPCVATGYLKSIDFTDDMQIMRLVSKYDDNVRFLNEPDFPTMTFINVDLHDDDVRYCDQEYELCGLSIQNE